MYTDVMKTLKKVIGDWGVLELLFCVMFFPLSLLYIMMRMVQESE